MSDSTHRFPAALGVGVTLFWCWLSHPVPLMAQNAVVWTQMSHAHAEGNSLVADDYNAAGRSTQTITADSGSFQITVYRQSDHVVAGLTKGTVASSRAEMPYAINLNGVSSAEIWENGGYKTETPYAVGDRFTLSVVAGTVSYLKNGVPFYTANGTAQYPLSLSALAASPVPGCRVYNAMVAIEEGDQTYLVTPFGTHVTIIPSSAQTVTAGSTVSFRVTAEPGYVRSNVVTGTAPPGSFAGDLYMTGPITTDCTVVFSATPIGSSGGISAFWANDGADKVTRDELRATTAPMSVRNSVWDGTTIRQFGARNEVISFNVILEAATTAAADVNVTLSNLTTGSSVIRSLPRSSSALFDWTGTECEMFFIRYLQIKGLSAVAFGLYNGSEPQIPEKLRLPLAGGTYAGGWIDRPNHDKYYPDIAVPLELVPSFAIPAGSNQSIWVDIYIPKSASAGLHTGTLTVSEGGTVVRRIPVALTVRNFELPDLPSAKTMVFTEHGDVALRYTGVGFPNPGTPADQLAIQVLVNQRLLAHRHKMSLIGDDPTQSGDSPGAEYQPVLSGSFFRAANGYAGPGVGIGNNVYSIGTYGSWRSNWGATQASMRAHTDNWESWFATYSPWTERFLYLIDESSDYAQTEMWSDWMAMNPGAGRNLPSLATLPAPAAAQVPSLTIPTATFDAGRTVDWQNAVDAIHASGKRYWMYNGHRPGSGAFCTECDGVDLRELPWGQHKKGVQRWFYWEATYYRNQQGGLGNTDVFTTAQTFGGATTFNSDYGQHGWNSSNGDGVLFYPGTDAIFPASSYGVTGPIASLRLKHWRRGIQDVDYLVLATARNAPAVAALVAQMVPQAMWELQVTDPSDPTYYANIGPSWSSNPDDWEAARATLADIIEGSGNQTAQLSAVRVADGILVMWDQRAVGWVLQQSVDLANWSNAAPAISTAGSFIDAGKAPRQFYRLLSRSTASETSGRGCGRFSETLPVTSGYSLTR